MSRCDVTCAGAPPLSIRCSLLPVRSVPTVAAGFAGAPVQRGGFAASRGSLLRYRCVRDWRFASVLVAGLLARASGAGFAGVLWCRCVGCCGLGLPRSEWVGVLHNHSSTINAFSRPQAVVVVARFFSCVVRAFTSSVFSKVAEDTIVALLSSLWRCFFRDTLRDSNLRGFRGCTEPEHAANKTK